MLLHPKRRIEKGHSHEKEVNGEHYPWILADPVPGQLHTLTPMNIIKDHH